MLSISRKRDRNKRRITLYNETPSAQIHRCQPLSLTILQRLKKNEKLHSLGHSVMNIDPRDTEKGFWRSNLITTHVLHIIIIVCEGMIEKVFQNAEICGNSTYQIQENLILGGVDPAEIHRPSCTPWLKQTPIKTNRRFSDQQTTE